jgi:pseudouridine kinase
VTPRIVCIGGANVDRSFSVIGPVHPATSNPAQVTGGFGGVARNVAENLARLGVDVALIARVGRDIAGDALLADARSAGIDTDGCIVDAAGPTSEYVAVLDSSRELVIAAVDDRIGAAFAAGEQAELEATLARAAWTFLDCNVPAAVVHGMIAAAARSEGQLAIDAVSIAKARRLPARLDGLALLFLNLDEGRAYTGRPEASAVEIAANVRDRGAQAVVVTLGAHGVLVADANGPVAIPAPPAKVVDVTGAGDALIAGTLFGLLVGEPLRAAVRTGTIVASLTIEAPTTVAAGLSAERVRGVSAEREQRV